MSLNPGVSPKSPFPDSNRSRYRTPIDWSAIERDYRRGGMSLRELAGKYGCSHSTIANFAGRQGWSRPVDLSPTPIHR
jgi:hypothetical protein